MWKITVLLLSLVTAVCCYQEGFPELEMPTNLAVRKDNNTSVTLFWDFCKPERVSSKRLEFVVKLESDGKPTRNFYVRHDVKPLQLVVKGLSPLTKYTVRMWATHPNWKDSSVARITFVTLEADYPTPIITGVSQIKHEKFVKYTLMWNLRPLLYWLEHLDVEVCKAHCVVYRWDRRDSSADASVEYQTAFTFRVIATYKLPGFGLITRPSKFYTGKTGTAPPKGFFESIQMEQVGNSVKLEWHPPFSPDGPLTYYEVFIDDPLYETTIDGEKSSGKQLKFRERLLNGSVYEVSIGGHSYDPADVTLARRPRTNQCIPPPLLHLVVLNSTTYAVHFRIFFPKPVGDFFHEIKNAARIRNLRLGPQVSDTFGLTAYQPLKMRIRSCFTYQGTTYDVCGNFSDFKTLSNVAAPSPVKYLEISVEDRNAVITWEEPEEPRGPIDGYRISIGGKHSRTVTLNSSARYYVVTNFDHMTSYVIGVAAFNLDMEDRTYKHMGDWTHVIPYNGFDSQILLATFGGFFAVLIITITIAGMCQARDRNAEGEAIELNENPNEVQVAEADAHEEEAEEAQEMVELS